MKKKLLCTFLCLLFGLSVFPFAAVAEKVDSETVDWGITMTAYQATPTGAVIVVDQSGGNYEGHLEYGSYYHVEVYRNNAWERVPYIRDDVAWTMEANLLPANHTTRWEKDWSWLYGELAPGRYRFVKEFGNYCEDADYIDADFYAEFVIGDLDQIVEPEPVETYTLTVEAPASWSSVYVYTREPETFGEFPGTEMTKTSENTYECKIDGNLTNFLFTSPERQQTSDLKIIAGRDVSIKIADDTRCKINYPDYPDDSVDQSVRVPAPETIGSLSDYRVVGDADWLGNWDAAFEGGRMIDMGNGVYRRTFEDVPPGGYQIKITKDGKWDNAYGNNGQNFCFTVSRTTKIAVDFVLKDGVGIINVYSLGLIVDEDEEENPKASDLSMIVPGVLLMGCAVALPVVLYRRKDTQ